MKNQSKAIMNKYFLNYKKMKSKKKINKKLEIQEKLNSKKCKELKQFIKLIFKKSICLFVIM